MVLSGGGEGKKKKEAFFFPQTRTGVSKQLRRKSHFVFVARAFSPCSSFFVLSETKKEDALDPLQPR